MMHWTQTAAVSGSLLLALSLGGCGNTALVVVVEGGSTRADAGSDDGGVSAPGYILGADITWVQADEAQGATYSDGTPRDILAILADHGFNYIRLRTFVDPKAADGYDKRDGFADLSHTITFGKRIKAAGMGFLLDFHYSDNWADTTKQCVPVAWQGYTTVTDLANAVHDYTRDAITQLVAEGARPDMVQVGNEITNGMLLHVCDASGMPLRNNGVTGSVARWPDLAMLLEAGVKGVKDVDPGIGIMLHIDACGAFETGRDFVDGALGQGVPFDVLGEPCTTAYQGSPAGWQSNFTQLAAAFPGLALAAAEYGSEERAANDIVFGLPGRQGIGTFNWEPTHTGPWNTGHALFTATGNQYTATADLALYDAMKTAYASRL